MNTAPSQPIPTAFRQRSSTYSAGTTLPAPDSRTLPRRRAEPNSNPARPASRATARPRQRPQSLWLILIVLSAACSCCIGLLYLSSYAQLAKEGYRRVQLLSELRTEQERAKEFQQLKAQVNTPEYIEKRAAAPPLCMTPANDAQTITIGTRG